METGSRKFIFGRLVRSPLHRAQLDHDRLSFRRSHRSQIIQTMGTLYSGSISCAHHGSVPARIGAVTNSVPWVVVNVPIKGIKAKVALPRAGVGEMSRGPNTCLANWSEVRRLQGHALSTKSNHRHRGHDHFSLHLGYPKCGILLNGSFPRVVCPLMACDGNMGTQWAIISSMEFVMPLGLLIWRQHTEGQRNRAK